MSFKMTKFEEEYAFQLSYGPSAKEEFIVCPIQHWSLGNIFNHSPEKQANLRSCRLLTPDGIVIALIAKKYIYAGE